MGITNFRNSSPKALEQEAEPSGWQLTFVNDVHSLLLFSLIQLVLVSHFLRFEFAVFTRIPLSVAVDF